MCEISRLALAPTSLGTMTNLEKMAIEIPVRVPSNGLVKSPQVTLACYPARVRLINEQAYSLGFACDPKKQ